jgi:FkbM family methyltransferase
MKNIPSIIKLRTRELFKACVPPVIWGAAKRIKLYLVKYHGANEIDARIEQYLDYRDGFYVELGAADGIGFSNTLYFELHKGWRGILVEPSPNNFLQCLANRSGRNHIFCNACTSFAYPHKFVEMVYAHYMSAAIGLESDVSNPELHAQSGARYLATNTERIFKYGAIARPLNQLLIEANAPKLIDFLSLDVEGAEIEVLKGIDHNNYKFKLLCIETRSPERLTKYLMQYGYQYIEQISHHDYIFMLNKVPDT